MSLLKNNSSRLSACSDEEEHQVPSNNNGSKPNYQAVSTTTEIGHDLVLEVVEDVSLARIKMRGRVLLFIVSFLYGTLNVSLRLVYATNDPPSASAMSSVRGWLAAICFVPFLLQQKSRVVASTTTSNTEAGTQSVPQRPLWMVALELALLNFGSQAMINVSLLFITSARAAFLTETSVVMTPLISAAAGYSVRWTVWVACFSAMIGVVILSNTKDGYLNFSAGDLLVLAGAMSWSAYIFRLSQCGSYNEVDLQFWKTVILASLYTVWFLISQWHSEVSLWAGYGNVVAWLLLFYSALGPGAIGDVLQQKAQASIAAAEANVILATEPIFTSILGFVLLAEAVTLNEFMGGSFIIAAAVLATR